jgi:hypothetical protein
MRFQTTILVAVVVVICGGVSAAQETASKPASAQNSEQNFFISDANRDWSFLLEGGDGHTDKVTILGSRTRLAVKVTDEWRVGAGYLWDTYINSDHVRNDVAPTLDAHFRPSQDQEYAARVDWHFSSVSSQAPTGLLESRATLDDGLVGKLRFAREVVQESMLSAVGLGNANGEAGQVRSDLATAGLFFTPNSQFDAFVLGSAGLFEGLQTPDNFTWSADAGFGFTERFARARLRLGYEALVSSFDKDASGFFNLTNPPGVVPGGYFSPQMYWTQQLTAAFDWDFADRSLLRVDAAIGPESFRDETHSLSELELNARAGARAEYRFADPVWGYVFYEYQNGGAYVEQHLFGFGVRVIF